MIKGSAFKTNLIKPWMMLYPVTLATAVPIVLAARSVVDKCPKDTVGAITSECSCKCTLQYSLVHYKHHALSRAHNNHPHPSLARM